MKKLFFLIMLLSLFVMPVWAQGDKPELPEGRIVYGDSVTGEITSREFEVEYPFVAEAGDVVVIEMGQWIYLVNLIIQKLSCSTSITM